MSEDMTIEEIIDLLAEVRTELELANQKIDLIGCELVQNIAEKLKEKK